MKLVIMLPAYNEENTIASVISRIPRDCADEVQVLVIDDGSTDRTVEKAKEAGADRIYSHGFNNWWNYSLMVETEIVQGC